MKVGGQIPWNVFPICEMLRNLSSDGKTPYEKTFWATIFEGPIIPFGSLVEVSPYNCEGPVKNPSIWNESLTRIVLRIRSVRGGNLEGWRSGCRETMDASEIYSKKTQIRKRWYFPNKANLFLQSQMDELKPLEGIKTWEHPPWYGSDQFKETVTFDFLGESEGSLPPPQDSLPDAGEAINDFWSMSGSFIYRHHVEPRVKTLLAERRIIPYSTEVHWRIQNYSYEFGCQAREAHRWLLECRWVSRLVWSLDWIHTIYSIGRKTSWRRHVVWGEINEKTAYIQARSFMARNLENNGKECKAEGEAKVVEWKSSVWRTHENCEGSLSLTPRIRYSKKPSRMLVRSWNHPLPLLCLAKLGRTIRFVEVVHPIKTRQNLRVFWKLVNLQDCVWENHCQKSSWRPYCRKWRQFITALQFGS